MGDMGEMYKAKRKRSQIKKHGNKKRAPEILNDENVDFITKNYGIHLIVEGDNGLIDFWPTTGKWIVRGGPTGRGIFSMVRKHCTKSKNVKTNESDVKVINADDESCPF